MSFPTPSRERHDTKAIWEGGVLFLEILFPVLGEREGAVLAR
jgi:hypothetical protein